MKAYIQEYSPEMWEEVVNLQLRDADVQEIYASSEQSSKKCLEESVKCSNKVWVIKLDNKIIGVFGVRVVGTSVGIPWLLASDDLKHIKLRFTMYSPLVVDEMMFLEGLNVLTNYVSVYHEEAIKWLKWCGFTFADEETFLLSPDIPFKQFFKWRTQCVNRQP